MGTVVDTEDSPDPLETTQQDLGSILWKKLRDGEYESAIAITKEQKYHQYLVHNSLDLVPVITKLLHEDLGLDGEKCVENLLVYIASVANSKEALLVFLEELEIHSSGIQFHVMLQPIQTLLLREVSLNTRSVTFSWVFNTLYSRISVMELPTGNNLEGKERKVLDVHPDVIAVTSALQWLKDFYEVFYRKVMNRELIWIGNVVSSREYLALFLLQLFHKPITYLVIYCDVGEIESSVYSTCSDLTSMIGNLLSNVFKLFSNIRWKNSKILLACEGNNDEEQELKGNEDNSWETEDQKEERKDEISQLSLASFFYCVLGQHMANDSVPCVYSHQYVFLSCLPLIASLLQEKEHIPIHKGLILAKTLLNNLGERSLPSGSLEAKAHSSFPQLLIRVMTFCDNKELRTIALDIFRSYLRKFDSVGRRKLIQALLLSVKHAGVLGLVIHELKENIALSLNQDNLDSNFCGKHLIKFVKVVCSLPDAEKTDMLEWSDFIMAALNLLIFLFVRDRENKTGIKEVVPFLLKDYLPQLQKGLDLSKSHYELKLKDISSPSNKEKHIEMSMCVGGSVLPNMPLDQEKKILQTAICSLDMMQCVLARVTQSIESKV